MTDHKSKPSELKDFVLDKFEHHHTEEQSKKAPAKKAAPSVQMPQAYKVTVEAESTYTSEGEAFAVYNGSFDHGSKITHTAKLIGPDGSVIQTRTWETEV